MITSTKIKYLLPLGLLVLSLNMILTRYEVLPDLASGLIAGVALGLMILALLNTQKLNKA